MRVDIDDIDIGIPKFQWLMGRLSTEDFQEKDRSIHKILMEEHGSKEALLSFLDKKYDPFLDMPVLIELRRVDGKIRFNLLDGYHRLAVLAYREETEAPVMFRHQGWGKQEWESGVLHACVVAKIRMGLKLEPEIPQQDYLHGESPFNLYLHGGPYEEKLEADSFLVSTGVRVPHIVLSMDNTECRGDDFEGPWDFRIEILFGKGKHRPILATWGSQPFNSYLVGHFDHLHKRVMIQQYFRGGNWGFDVPNFDDNGVCTVREQIAQDEVAIPILYETGILKVDTPIYYADQSTDKPGALEDYFQLFTGLDSLEQYLQWLPTYLKKCRSNHFKIPIEEVIQCVPT